jgi:CBS domain-containing protein
LADSQCATSCADIQIGEVLAFRKKAVPVPSLWAHSTATEAAQRLATAGIHRACVFDEQGNLSNVIS